MSTTTPSELPPSRARSDSALELLETVDRLPKDAAGELVIRRGGERVGSIYVERGRVCWAAARGLARRLSDLLAERTRPPLDRAAMEALFVRGREERRPLGELLVGTGLLDPDDLCDALLRHSAESFVELGRAPSLVTWSRRRGGGYDADFTFSTGELAAGVCAVLFDRAPPPSLAFDDMPLVDMDVAFARDPRTAHPIPIAARGAITAKDLLALARRLPSALDLAAAASGGEPRFVVFGDHGGGGTIAWTDGEWVRAASTGDPRVLSRAIARVFDYR